MSLLLLGTFIGLYIKKNYTDASQALQKEIGYLFVNAVQGLEGNLLNDIIFNQPMTKGRVVKDSLKIMTFVGSANSTFKETSQTQSVDIRVNSSSDIKLNEVHGAISMILDVQSDSLQQEICFEPKERKEILEEDLRKKFDENLKKAGISIDYEIMKTKKNNPLNASISGSMATYLDVMSGDRFDVMADIPWMSLVKQILPEVFFGLSVFGFIWLAFYFTQKSLNNEKKLALAKNDFIQNMTHELKTPLATASVALEALSEFNAISNEEKRNEYLGVTRNELNRLSGIVDKVLSIQTMDKNQLTVHPERFEVRVAVQEVLLPMKMQLEQKQMELIFEGDHDALFVESDKTLFKGILFNLLDNAIKYGKKEGGKITIRLMEKQEEVFIEMTDNGIGIPQDQQKKVFQKFYRVPHGTVHNVKGYGLGLAFVQAAVQSLKGSIQLISEPEVGTTFTVSLPKRWM